MFTFQLLNLAPERSILPSEHRKIFLEGVVLTTQEIELLCCLVLDMKWTQRNRNCFRSNTVV